MTKHIKIFLALIIFVLILGIMTNVNASGDQSFYFYSTNGQRPQSLLDESEGDFTDDGSRWEGNLNHGLNSIFSASLSALKDQWVMCIRQGARLKNTDTPVHSNATGTIERFEGHLNCGKGWEDGKSYEAWIQSIGLSSRFDWMFGTKNSRYETICTLIGAIGNNTEEAQAAIYALYNSTNIDMAQKLMWGLGLNDGSHAGQADTSSITYQEAVEYGKYWTMLQQNGGLNQTNTTNMNEVKVIANQTEQYYLVGPFTINYVYGCGPIREDGNKVNFSEITSLKVLEKLNDTETRELKLLDIVNQNGKSIKNGETHQGYGYPVPGEVFYVKFEGIPNETVKKIHLDIHFNYIQNFTATLYEYKGEIYEYHIEQHFESGPDKFLTCTKEEHKHGSDCYDEGTWCDTCGAEADGDCDALGHSTRDYADLICTKEEHTHTAENVENGCYRDCNHTVIEVKRNLVGENSEVQKMLAYSLDAKPHYGEADLRIPYETPDNPPDIPQDIPVTMKIAGKVFLDADGGKANMGNNKLDVGEELAGIDVWLYRKDDDALMGVRLTDSNGYYEFDNLDALKKYYVKIGYNGMLYTNVQKANMDNFGETMKISSKMEEHSEDRNRLNLKFAEIGSYPYNYKTTDFESGNEIYNKVYFQEDLVDLFKEVAREIVNKGGNEVEAYRQVINNHSGDGEIRSKVNFIKDCRIYAYSEVYPRMEVFVIDNKVVYGPYGPVNPIYNSQYELTQAQLQYDQLTVNLGIKNRPTFDLGLYKDVFKATVQINGKTETYTYDDRKAWVGAYNNGFPIGVSENDYLSSVRANYLSGTGYYNSARLREVEQDTYTLETRTEEITNGKMTEVKDGLASAYTELTGDDRLKIYITYKIAIKNQSGVAGAITEIVDYYDNNYQFFDAYLEQHKKDDNGNEIIEKIDVAHSTESKYGNNTEYKSTKGAYQTIYLRPTTETWLNNNEQQYIFVTLELKNSDKDAGTILSEKLLNGEKLTSINVAEINGYKTSEGLIDIDSNPGNLNISNVPEFTDNEVKKHQFEDDTSKAPSFIYSWRESRSLEGTVFEDSTGKDSKYYTNEIREGNGIFDDGEQGIEGVLVQLWERKGEPKDGKDGELRAYTYTDENGKYGFIGFVPGEYYIKYVYGSQWDSTIDNSFKNVGYGKYNGQDYEPTKYDAEKHNNYYWYKIDNRLSDAVDNNTRVQEVIKYSNSEYGVGITNHKAEVFNSIYDKNSDLLQELKENTCRDAWTQQMSIDMEYESMSVAGNQSTEKYEHKITNVDFGIVERPHEKIKIEKEVSHVKLTLTDGTVLFDADGETVNLQWVKEQLINLTVDEEQISGAKLEITYSFKVTNLSESNTGTTKIVNIVDYVANNLNFDNSLNPKWEVVSVSDLQKDGESSLVNKGIDLSTRTTTIKAAANNPLLKTLAPGQSEETSLVLTKVLSTENVDDLSYDNTVEIVEYVNDIGRYDRESIPGNLVPDTEPQKLPDNITKVLGNIIEEDSAKAETVAALPPFGSIMIYYALVGVVLVILGVGIFLIKKKVVDKK